MREIIAEHPEYEQQIQNNRQLRPSAVAPPLEGPVYPIGHGVSRPRLIQRQEPQYSPEALKAKMEGAVLLTIVVDKTGLPQDIRVIRPLGLGLDEKAIEAVQQWRFKPGTKDGQPVATSATVEVNFRLLKTPSQQ